MMKVIIYTILILTQSTLAKEMPKSLAIAQNFNDKMAKISKQMNEKLPHRQDKILVLSTTTYVLDTFTYHYIFNGIDAKTKQELEALAQDKIWINNMKKTTETSLVNQYCTRAVLKRDLERGLKVRWIHSMADGRHLFDAIVSIKDCK